MTEKAVNYTVEQTTKMVADYVANPSMDTVGVIAKSLGKTVKSVIAKLSREKVYIAKVRTTKNGEPIVKKDEFATEIADMLGMNENDADSLTKANKTALKLIADFIRNEKIS